MTWVRLGRFGRQPPCKVSISALTAPSQLALRVAELEGQILKLNGLLRLLGFEPWFLGNVPDDMTDSIAISSHNQNPGR